MPYPPSCMWREYSSSCRTRKILTIRTSRKRRKSFDSFNTRSNLGRRPSSSFASKASYGKQEMMSTQNQQLSEQSGV